MMITPWISQNWNAVKKDSGASFTNINILSLAENLANWITLYVTNTLNEMYGAWHRLLMTLAPGFQEQDNQELGKEQPEL